MDYKLSHAVKVLKRKASSKQETFRLNKDCEISFSLYTKFVLRARS